MSTFDAGSISGHLTLDTSGFSQAMQESEGVGGEFAASLGELFQQIGLSPELAGMGRSIANTLTSAFSGDWSASVMSAFHVITEGAAGLIDTVKEEAETFEQMGLRAKKLGIGVEEFSSISMAAQASGVSVDQLSAAWKFLERNSADAIEGNKKTVAAFADIGISVEDLKVKLRDPGDLFFAVMDGMKGLKDQNLKTADSMELMGRAGDDLIPIMDEGSGSVQELAKQIRDVGGAVDENDVKLAEKSKETQIKLEASYDAIKKKLTEPILAYLTAHSDELVKDVQKLGDAFTTFLVPALENTISAFQTVGGWIDTASHWVDKITPDGSKQTADEFIGEEVAKRKTRDKEVAQYLSAQNPGNPKFNYEKLTHQLDTESDPLVLSAFMAYLPAAHKWLQQQAAQNATPAMPSPPSAPPGTPAPQPAAFEASAPSPVSPAAPASVTRPPAPSQPDHWATGTGAADGSSPSPSNPFAGEASGGGSHHGRAAEPNVVAPVNVTVNLDPKEVAAQVERIVSVKLNTLIQRIGVGFDFAHADALARRLRGRL